MKPKSRFKLQEFVNPRTGSKSWRVSGTRRDGSRIRENFPDPKSAQCRQVELEAEFLSRAPDDPTLRATKLTDVQLRIAEAVFPLLKDDNELVSAVDHWRKHGQQHTVSESPRLDEAVKQFLAWLDGDKAMREISKRNLGIRVNIFAGSSPSKSVSDFRPEDIELFLDKRDVSPVTRDNDRRAISRFFSWCIERPRRWASTNPCRDVRVARPAKPRPAILTVQECEAMLRAAEKINDGRLVPYLALGLFAGLRPMEIERATWEQINLHDREISIGVDSKTKRPRVVEICDTLAAWLTAYKGTGTGKIFWSRRSFDAIKKAAGYGGRGAGEELKRWTVDALRHTSASHLIRRTGGYGRAAEQFGNSEAILKRHYQGRVSTADMTAFYGLLPTGQKTKKPKAK